MKKILLIFVTTPIVSTSFAKVRYVKTNGAATNAANTFLWAAAHARLQAVINTSTIENSILKKNAPTFLLKI